QACQAQVEILPLPRKDPAPAVETSPAPLVSASHIDSHDIGRRQKLDDWIMYQPVHHPHVCSTCDSKHTAPCCEAPLYAYFIAGGDKKAAGCQTEPQAGGPVCVKHPILSFWQNRVCCMRAHIAGTVESFKMSATCPMCGKRPYLALWHLHEC